MGSGSPVVCDECDEEFMAMSGAGFTGTAVRCVDCGDPAFSPRDGWESDDTPALPEHCKCGGTFSEDGPFRCPNCNKLFSQSEVDRLESRGFLLWD